MALNLDEKKAIVAEVSTIAASALSAVAAEYRGITVGDMTELRVKARNEGVYLRVCLLYTSDAADDLYTV